MRQHLLAKKYEVSYVCRTKETGELQSCQSFTLDQNQISDLIEEQTLQLRSTCNLSDCCKGTTAHVVNVKLDKSSQCSLLVNSNLSKITDGHTHVGYKHWFAVRPDTSELVSLSVSRVEDLVSVLRKCKQCKLYVLMLNCDSVLGK